jgi:hypothetical protein
MALRVAVANGNWSNPATWLGGILPSLGDIVASNNFTVTIDQDVNVNSISNLALTRFTEVPLMTSNTTPSGIASANFEQSGQPAWFSFNRQTSVGNGLYGSNAPAWLAYEFPELKIINAYQLILRNDQYDPKDWTFEGWNGTNWIVLHTVVNNAGSYNSPNLGNTTPYLKYRINVSATRGNFLIVVELYLFVLGGTENAVAGGGFILNGGVTVTCTNTDYGLLPSSSSVVLLTYSGSGIATVNASIAISPNNNASFPTLLFTGSGTLNINGTIKGYSSQSHGGGNMRTLVLNGSGTVNIIGNIEASYVHDSAIITTSNNVTVNHTGDIFTTFVGGNSGSALSLGLSTWTTTGTITGYNRSSVSQITVGSTARFFHIGTILAGPSGAGVINNVGFAQLTSIMNVGLNSQVCLLSTSTTAINLCTGPFICSNYGFFPYLVARMHLIPTTSSYFEFRDETTNGAVSPSPAAPATRLVSPATLVSNLATSDVRFGIVYALGTLTGTLRMPVANQVTFGIPVDNTSGNAVLTAASVWDYLVSNITTADSIGMRLKNVATPQTTGEQLEAFLRLD